MFLRASHPADCWHAKLRIDLRLALAAQAFMAVAWVGLLRIYGPRPALAPLCLLAAALLTTLGVRADDRSPRAPRTRALFVASLYSLLAWAVGMPDAMPLALLAASEWLAAGLARVALGRRLAAALWLLGLSGNCQWLAASAIRYATLRARYWPGISALAAAVLDRLGLGTANVDGVLYVNTSTQLLRVTPNAEKLGLVYVALFLAGIIPLLALGRRPVAACARVALLSALFIPWRYVAIVSIYAQTQLVDCFWDPVANGAFLAIFAVAIHFALRQTPVVWISSRPEPTRMLWATPLVAALAAALLWAVWFEDPGSRKQGRILIDESHSDWEWTERHYDTGWYGDKAGYNYATLFDHLAHYYATSRNEKGTIDARLLRACDVLILKTPTRAYSRDEVDAIVSFVEGGGGLYLIGDHTNVFGMTTYLNAVASRFGFEYGYDATYELATGTLQQFLPPGRLRDPTIIHLPAKFLFGTSCSVRPGWFSRVSICGYNVRALYLDYSRRSFFPEGHLESSMDFGWIAQGISQKVGRGRVAAFTDSTIFSNFWYFIPGKSELFVGTVEWLNRANSGWSQVARWGPLAAALAAAFLARNSIRAMALRAALAPLLAGAVSGAAAADYANHRAYTWPVAIRPVITVAFDRRYSDLNIPAYELPGGARSFHTFYTLVQRLGCVPKAADEGLSDLDVTPTLVMVYPRAVPNSAERRRLRRWLESGGTLLVLDGSANPSPAANDWLPEFGLRFQYNSQLVGDIEDIAGKRWSTGPAAALVGGEPLLTLRPHHNAAPPGSALADAPVRPGVPVGAVAPVGRGRVVAIGLADSFQDAVMGTTRVVPNEHQRELYELEYALLRSITGRTDGPRLPFPHHDDIQAQDGG